MIKKQISSLCLGLLLIIVWACASRPIDKNNALVDLGKPETIKSITPGKGVMLSINDDSSSLHMQWTTGPTPTIVVHQYEAWNLSRFKYLTMEITNAGPQDVLVECRPVAEGWFGCGMVIPAGQTVTHKTYITRTNYPDHIAKAFKGMNALPGGWVSMFFSPDPDSIKYFSINVINPPSPGSLHIKNIRGEEPLKVISEKELDNYFPMVDSLGQFKYATWPGKTTSHHELAEADAQELSDIAKHPAPKQWNEYGGWQDGPTLNATGHFRTQKVDGKWWLVDPVGKLFWSHGMGSVSVEGGGTPVTDRAHYFEGLPDSVRFARFYNIETYNPKGYYKDRVTKVFDHYRWNLFHKYGTNYRAAAGARAHARLHSWGQNTIGGWSSSEIYNQGKTPYTVTLELRSAPIAASEGQWGKFPDPYHGSLEKEIKESIERNQRSADDPYCIGYFVDNELSWGDSTYLAEAILKSPAHQPAKQAMQRWLEERYSRVEKLNAQWHTHYTNWDDFLNANTIPLYGKADLKEFTAVVTHHYFKTILKTLRSIIPHKLYLGCRFDFHFYPSEDKTYDWLVKIAAQYCDVVSFNRYRYSAIDLMAANTDKPVMIGEWHVGALDRGMLHYSLRFAQSQQQRAALFEYYLQTCLRNPYIVGAHWFQYIDEPVTGRYDGENYNTGFLDVCDRPYPEMIDVSRRIGSTMYAIRSEKNKIETEP